MRKAAMILAAALFLPLATEAQLPRCRTSNCKPSSSPPSGGLTYMGSFEVRNLLSYGAFWHVVTVDSGGAGDYTDLGDALAYVASQTPTADARWSVEVYPGNTSFSAGGFSYTESSITIPQYTTVSGYGGAWLGGGSLAGQAWIKLTATSGTLATLSEGASLVNVGLYASANPTAARKVVVAADADADNTLRNVAIIDAGTDGFATTLLSVEGAFIYADGLFTQRANLGTLARNIKVTGGALVAESARTYPGVNQPYGIEVTGGTLQLTGGKIIPGALTADLLNSGGSVEVDGMSYNTFSGTIERGGVLSTKHTAGTTIPATCAVPETFTDTTSGAARECVCVASNTWVCNARAQESASPPYACDAGHAGASYTDSTTPSLCFCSGGVWRTTVVAGDCT